MCLRVGSSFLGVGRAVNWFSPYTREEWNALEEKALELTYPPFPEGGCLSDRVETWILEGYAYKEVCCVSEGDMVIDGGAYTGETACYFAQKCGERGRVFSFEPGKDSFEKLKSNVERFCPDNVVCVQAALSDTEGKEHFSIDEGNLLASRISEAGKETIDCVSMDFFAEKEKITPSFIKLDIEGYELKALLGAKAVIKRDRPKLAICVYHEPHDIFDLPELILSFDNRYDFYLKHNSRWDCEVVLFAVPTDSPKKFIKQGNSPLVEFSRGVEAKFQELYAPASKVFFGEILEELARLLGVHLESTNEGKFYVCLPFSEDGTMHYEFLLIGWEKCLEVGLHLESEDEDLCKKVQEALWAETALLTEGISFELVPPSRDCCECAFKIPHDLQENRADTYASVMNLLMRRSFPILSRFDGLLSESFRSYFTQVK
jgi:FkbM family methyltransferase